MAVKTIGIIIIAIIVIGVGVWLGLGNREATEEPTISPTEETTTPTEEAGSLTEILSKAKGVTSLKYDLVVTAPGQKAATQNVWLKGNNMKTQMTVAGQTTIYILDSDNQVAYMYNPDQNMATKMELSDAQESVEESPIEKSESVMSYNPAIVGSETLDGKNCSVVEYTAGGVKVKMWIWKEHGFPIKTESTTAAGTSTVEFKNIELVDIPDSTFKLPEGVQIIEIPSGS
jgi:outer membrane lipoprotein-sorting protein